MNYANAKLASLTPAAPGWNAVFVSEDGDPELEPIACWGLYQIDDENAVLAMTRSAGDASRLVPADLDPAYVGIAAPGEHEEDWADACNEHFADLGAAEADEDEAGDEGEEGDEEEEEDDEAGEASEPGKADGPKGRGRA
ncbi:MAG: hypothetical protein MUF34_06090 [Polyangiaceae bacterium]|jgi:hypothetical protein|nr:hypothetical protein [Polyangiaceae bacterium]